MKCTRCQMELEQGTNVCPNCGQETFRGYVKMPANVEKSMITLVLLSILSLFCCNVIGGAVGITFTIFAILAFVQGEFAKYEKRRKIAIYALIGGVIVTALCGVAYGGFMMFMTSMGLGLAI